MSMRKHKATASLFVLACAAAAFWPSSMHAQDTQLGTIEEQLVGSWMLVSITTHVGAMRLHPMPTDTVNDTQPYGPNPKGKLAFERNGRFASTVVNSDRSKPASSDPEAPAEFEASSGTYSMHPSRPNPVIFHMG